jgi:hypothetical protein
LSPEPVQRRTMALARLSLTNTPVESLLGRVGTLQGTRGRAPGRPQGSPPLTERVEDVERVVEVGQAGGESAGTLELHPLAQARAVVPDHGLERRESGEFLGPCRPVARLDHPPRQPTKALGFDDHQDGLTAEKISQALGSWCAIGGELHWMKAIRRGVTSNFQDDFVGRIVENTPDEPP